MTHYIIYFNQQWVGSRGPQWIAERAPLANAVVEDMKTAGVYIYAGGVDDISTVASADATSGMLTIRDRPFAPSQQHLGGLTIIDVPDDATAKLWAGRLAEGCGWPQEVRRIS